MSKNQSEFINALESKIKNSIRVSLPATIESYDFKTQKCDVKIGIQELFKDGSTIDYPILSGVPVIFPASGGAFVTMPVAKGDSCLLVFMDRDSTSWLLSGNVTTPKSTRSHHLSDAVAILGLSSFNKPTKAKNNKDMLISFSGSEVTLKPNGIIDITSAKEINVKTESIVINCKNVNLNVQEQAEVACKSAIVNAQEGIAIEGQNINITSRESLNANCVSLIANISNEADISCATANIHATSKINTESPTFTHTGDMKVVGKVEITGITKISGALTTEGGITNSGSNLVSNGKTFETHTHTYDRESIILTGATPGAPCDITLRIPTATGAP